MDRNSSAGSDVMRYATFNADAQCVFYEFLHIPIG